MTPSPLYADLDFITIGGRTIAVFQTGRLADRLSSVTEKILIQSHEWELKNVKA